MTDFEVGDIVRIEAAAGDHRWAKLYIGEAAKIVVVWDDDVLAHKYTVSLLSSDILLGLNAAEMIKLPDPAAFIALLKA